MADPQIHPFINTAFNHCCWLIYTEDRTTAILVDPIRSDLRAYENHLRQKKLKLLAAIDLGCATDSIQIKRSALAYYQEAGQCMTLAAQANKSHATIPLRPNEELRIEDIRFKVVSCSGFAQGALALIGARHLFTGQALPDHPKQKEWDPIAPETLSRQIEEMWTASADTLICTAYPEPSPPRTIKQYKARNADDLK